MEFESKESLDSQSSIKRKNRGRRKHLQDMMDGNIDEYKDKPIIKYPVYNDALILNNVSTIHIILQNNILYDKLTKQDFEETLKKLKDYFEEEYYYDEKKYTLYDTFKYSDDMYKKEEEILLTIFLNFVKFANNKLRDITFIIDEINNYTRVINNKILVIENNEVKVIDN